MVVSSKYQNIWCGGICCTKKDVCINASFFALKNAFLYFQSTILPLFDDLKESMEAWTDKFTLHTKTKTRLLKHFSAFFNICKQYNLGLPEQKRSFYARKVKRCRRIFDGRECQLDPRNIEQLAGWSCWQMLQIYVRLLNVADRWETTSQNFHRRMKPLNEILDRAYITVGKSKMSALENIYLPKLSSGTAHDTALVSIGDSFLLALKLRFSKKKKTTHYTCTLMHLKTFRQA